MSCISALDLFPRLKLTSVAHHFKIIKQLLVQCTDLSSPSAMVASQWLGLRLQFLGVAMVTGVAFIAVLEHHFSTVDPGINVCSQCLGWSFWPFLGSFYLSE